MNKYSVSIDGHRTSFSLEAEFYLELKAIAKQRSSSVAGLVRRIDHARAGTHNLSSALRIFILKDLKNRIAEGSQS